MAHFIDRRLNGKNKSAVNRQRFLRRYKSQIKDAVKDAVNKRSIRDLESGENVTIPQQDISEPSFGQGSGGNRSRVLPGNDQFVTGDKIERPPPQQDGQGAGDGDASDQGEGNDDFQFQISRDEYLDIVFEDLELPNLQQTEQASVVEYKTHRAGYANEGVASNINIVRSLQSSLMRRVALGTGKRKQLAELEAQLAKQINDPLVAQADIIELREQIEQLKSALKRIPFIDTFDVKYNNFVKHPVPSSQAVMFCLMDVSGSMDQATKDIAKRFYLLLYLFLSRKYKQTEVVFIRHHTQAKEVDEHEFFYSQETGGTIVSSALKLMQEIVSERYPQNQWNVYAAQASDGDNWADDSPLCHQLLDQSILPNVRHYSYVEITKRSHQSLWREYQRLAQSYDNFAIKNIGEESDVVPVFREIFKKQLNHN